MADHTEKKKAGAIKHYLSREQFNSLCSIMSFIALDATETRYSSFADYMLYKLIRYSTKFGKDYDTFLIRLYPNEAELLLQIYIIFVSGYVRASDRIIKDYSSIVGTKKLGESYDKEKNISSKIEDMIQKKGFGDFLDCGAKKAVKVADFAQATLHSILLCAKWLLGRRSHFARNVKNGFFYADFASKIGQYFFEKRKEKC